MSVKTAKKQRGKPFEKGVSGNPNGRPKGTLNFNTHFENALLKLSKSKTKDVDTLDEKLVSVGLKLALDGDFRYWQSIMERRYGKIKDQLEIKSPEEQTIIVMSEAELRDIEHPPEYIAK